MFPTWLTEEYIQIALRGYYKDTQLCVLKVWAKPATEKGENYVGVMTRIYVDFELADGGLQKKSFILKQGVPPDAPQADLFAEYDVYNRELEMYDVVLPKMSAILREANFNEKLMADAIVVDRKRTIMILEDLAPLHYTNADRVKQLDIVHTKLVLDMLAKFHAAAIILDQREPQLLRRNYNSHFFSREKKGYEEVFVGLFKAFIRYVKNQPILWDRYGKKLEHTISHLMEYAAKSVDVTEKDFQTLIHGDCWTTNVMYQYDDEGNPTTVLPIDFQFSSWTHPTVDLHYFFSTSLKTDVKERESELVQYHFYSLKRTLEALSYKGYIPSLFEYQLQFERRRFLSVVIANVFQPIMVYEGCEDPEFVNLYQDTPQGIRFQDSMYESKEIQRRIEEILPILDSKGFLDAH
ncbi:uncharacterized protein Dana_GF16372 [Drosophila ananassae]|uniref:CHK kinase-like domain-containing protein n=1 Tax=Drosophila ananassae TaxID=7217 RepID=B3LVV8_DROAN|nr:uncharacterized protein LOC6499168 [Drosophila ananassae]XP_044570983.1 uncharacterized protein LOC6499168 [Drosophila ananassae]EDV43732.2 uncharacterized protein Dana_GF16372 [Drosophila ananassae]